MFLSCRSRNDEKNFVYTGPVYLIFIEGSRTPINVEVGVEVRDRIKPGGEESLAEGSPHAHLIFREVYL
jgi:hypothetical protein